MMYQPQPQQQQQQQQQYPVQVEMTQIYGGGSAVANNYGGAPTTSGVTSGATVTSSVTSSSMATSCSGAPLLGIESVGDGGMGNIGGIRGVTCLRQLLACSMQKVPMKDFGSEVRAAMDIAHFLSQATLVLDVAETSLEGICDLLLTRLLQEDEPLCSVAEAKSILFTHDTCEYHLLFTSASSHTHSSSTLVYRLLSLTPPLHTQNP